MSLIGLKLKNSKILINNNFFFFFIFHLSRSCKLINRETGVKRKLFTCADTMHVQPSKRDRPFWLATRKERARAASQTGGKGGTRLQIEEKVEVWVRGQLPSSLSHTRGCQLHGLRNVRLLHSQAHLHSSFGAAVATPAPRGKNNDAARFADIFLSRKQRETSD